MVVEIKEVTQEGDKFKTFQLKSKGVDRTLKYVVRGKTHQWKSELGYVTMKREEGGTLPTITVAKHGEPERVYTHGWSHFVTERTGYVKAGVNDKLALLRGQDENVQVSPGVLWMHFVIGCII